MTDRYSDGPKGTTCREGCGACCVVVPLGLSQADVRRMLPEGHPLAGPGVKTIDARTREWILEELTEISPSEALEDMPWVKDRPSVMVDENGVPWMSGLKHYYRCSNFDAATTRCARHADRPDVCRGFPYYGHNRLAPQLALPSGCSFREDRGEPVDTEWQPVTIRRAKEARRTN